MEASDQSKISIYLEEAFSLQEKGSSYAAIRLHFEKKRLNDEAISYLIRLVDEFVMEEEKIEAKIRASRFRIIFGVLVVMIGLLISYLFYTNASLQGIYLALALTPVASGLAIIWTGFRQLIMWKNHQPEIDDSKLKLIKRIG